MENNLSKLAKLIRYYILTMTSEAGSGHTTSSLSAVELMVALMFGVFRADLDHPENPNNDRLIFSKGHASPLFYSLYAAAGKVTQDELMKYRKFTSPLEGHPTLRFPYTEAPTGSLGQGLSIGLGEALALRMQALGTRQQAIEKNRPNKLMPNAYFLVPRVFVLLGDGEMAEGSVWEAIQLAAYHKIDNLIGILDVNGLGQSQKTMYGHNVKEYQKRVEAFGWETVIVDGHDISQIAAAFGQVKSSKLKVKSEKRPFMIIAKTDKGHGIKMLEGKEGWHGKPLPPDQLNAALADLGEVDLTIRGKVEFPLRREISNSKSQISNKIQKSKVSKIDYKLGDKVATRQAAGDGITDLMYRYPQVVVLDGDVKNSLYTENTQKAHPERYFEMFIAEQNMADAAIGMWRRGYIPFVTTFSAFMTRAYDQIRMAGLAGANIKFFGSHVGVSIGEDGASQMGLEDLAMFRTIFGSRVLYPADAVSTQELLQEMVKDTHIVYIRTSRPPTPTIYNVGEKFPIGGSKVHRVIPKLLKSLKKLNKVVIVTAGVTLYEALKAQEEMMKENIEAIVVDAYSIKPIDGKTLRELAREISYSDRSKRGPTSSTDRGEAIFITVEDHWYEGGLGDAVLEVFACPGKLERSGATDPRVYVYKLAVGKLPRSGKPQQLLDFEGISAKGIVAKAKEILGS